mgnify:CR=1 FL=1
MDDRVDLLFLKDLAQMFFIPKVILIKGGFPSGKLLDALHSHGLAVAEVIHNDHLMALLKQDNTGVAADISGAAGDKDPHKRTLLPDFSWRLKGVPAIVTIIRERAGKYKAFPKISHGKWK